MACKNVVNEMARPNIYFLLDDFFQQTSDSIAKATRTYVLDGKKRKEERKGIMLIILLWLY